LIKGITLDKLAETLAAQRNAARDYVVDTRAIKLGSKNGNLAATLRVNGEDLNLHINDYALYQMAEHCGIPRKYVEKIRAEGATVKVGAVDMNADELLVANFRHWLESDSSVRMLRTFQGLGPEPYIRAFLSDRFRALDNYDLADNLIPILQDAGVQIRSCDVTDRKLYIQAVFPRLYRDLNEIREELKARGAVPAGHGWVDTVKAAGADIVQAGIVISNSEVGDGRLKIEQLIERLSCTNGLIVNDIARRNHVGRRNGQGGDGDDFESAREFFTDETRAADDKAFWLKLRDTVQAQLTDAKFEDVVRKFAGTMNVELGTGSDPDRIVEVTAKRCGFTDSEKKGFIANLLSDRESRERFTLFDAVNSVTRLAQDAESYDRAVELERLGGSMVDLKKSDFSRN
jgi:AraC-like DNA-binding protein